MTDSILEARDVSLVRSGTTILDGISLSVRPTERVLIQGESGAGKTTLFQLLGLLEPPTAGSIRVDGTDATDLKERQRAELRREKIGFVFQDFQLIPDLTAWENARLPQEHRSGDNGESEWLHSVFEELDITDLTDQYPASLSGGERQRVAIARALANRPSVVLADEPTGQLDPDTTEQVLDLLFQVQAEADAALVVISHDERLTDRFPAGYSFTEGGLERIDDDADRSETRPATTSE
ncbi:MAG: ABC transporter ATP-binding protein [Halobacteriales archaeon]